MLLSDTQVSSFLDEHFVLYWHSLRPAPKVTIDFGGGHVLERTLKGNTCFYVVRPDGQVADALPGVYLPEVFIDQLQQSLHLVAMSPHEALAFHRSRAESARLSSDLTTLSKAPVQSPILAGLGAEPPQEKDGLTDLSAYPLSLDELDTEYLPGSGDLAQRALQADSESSLRVLRPAVHTWFGGLQELPQPEQCRSHLFSEVLGIDLDDPYLGLKFEGMPGTP